MILLEKLLFASFQRLIRLLQWKNYLPQRMNILLQRMNILLQRKNYLLQ
jgi:hypothetical protein